MDQPLTRTLTLTLTPTLTLTLTLTLTQTLTLTRSRTLLVTLTLTLTLTRWIGTVLYLCLLVLTLLPISYLHSKMLFNSAFADTLSQVNNRRQLMGELYTLFTIRASSFYQLGVLGLKRLIKCLALWLFGYATEPPPPAFEPSWSALPATLSHMAHPNRIEP